MQMPTDTNTMPKADVNCTLLSNPVEEGMKKQTETDRKPSKILTNFGIAFRVNFEVFLHVLQYLAVNFRTDIFHMMEEMRAIFGKFHRKQGKRCGKWRIICPKHRTYRKKTSVLSMQNHRTFSF